MLLFNLLRIVLSFDPLFIERDDLIDKVDFTKSALFRLAHLVWVTALVWVLLQCLLTVCLFHLCWAAIGGKAEHIVKFRVSLAAAAHASARTADLTPVEAGALYQKALTGACTPQEADLFRGQMLTEMARMSLDDGLVMQIHPGSHRNHNAGILARHGRDMGFDIPGQTDYVNNLKPLLNAVGMEPGLRIILFTLDETAYGRELAPLAGAYPSLTLGPPWWFFDSFEGIRKFREAVTETCGFYNTAGFNDDTRAFCSIPSRHDVARRADCNYLAGLVGTGRLREAEAFEVARDLTYGLAKTAYNL